MSIQKDSVSEGVSEAAYVNEDGDIAYARVHQLNVEDKKLGEMQNKDTSLSQIVVDKFRKVSVE